MEDGVSQTAAPSTRETEPRSFDAHRLQAAEALRELGHALVAHDADEATFNAVTEAASTLRQRLGSGPRRIRADPGFLDEIRSGTPLVDGPADHFTDCVMSGSANPMGVAMTVERRDDRAIGTARLGPAFESAPGRVHGGIVAALFDDITGFIPPMLGVFAYTATLQVSFRAPTPIEQDLAVQAWLHQRIGRRLLIKAQISHDGVPVAEADAVFVAVAPLGTDAAGT